MKRWIFLLISIILFVISLYIPFGYGSILVPVSAFMAGYQVSKIQTFKLWLPAQNKPAAEETKTKF